MKYNYFEDIEIPEDINLSVKKGIERAKIEKQRSNKKYMMIASMIVVILTGGIITTQTPIYASVNKLIYDISHMLGIEKDLDDYKSVINKTIDKEGVGITLNEVILDDKEIIISTTYKSKDDVDNGYINSNLEVYINGELSSGNSNGFSEPIGNNTVNSISNIELKNEYDGEVDIKVVYSDARYNINNEYKEINEEWVFEFSASSEILNNNTKRIQLDEKFNINNDEIIELNEYVSNDLGQKIIYSRQINDNEYYSYNKKLIGKDDLGNEVIFYNSRSDENTGIMELDNYDRNLDEYAKRLYLSLYVSKEDNESGEMNDDFVKIGEMFSIEID